MSLTLFRDAGYYPGLGLALSSLANLSRAEGDYAQAEDLFRESLTVDAGFQDRRTASHRLWFWGILEARSGAHDRGVRLLSAGARHGVYGTSLYPADREDAEAALAAARSALGEEAFARAWAEGREMSLEQAVEHALGRDNGG